MQAETIAHERLAAPAAVAEALEIPVGEDVLFTRGAHPHRRDTAPAPLELDTGVARAGHGPGFRPAATRRTSCASCSATSLSFRRFVIEATTADAAVADLLEIEPGAAILVNERVLETAEGLPIEFGFTRHRGDRSFFYAAGAGA